MHAGDGSCAYLLAHFVCNWPVLNHFSSVKKNHHDRVDVMRISDKKDITTENEYVDWIIYPCCVCHF